jgi:hypothetical protein
MIRLKINPDRVLIVTNSDIPQSHADAVTYAGLRGLTFRELAANLGTINGECFPLALIDTNYPLFGGGGGPLVSCQTAPYIGQSLMAAVSDYITNHNIECVLVSTYTPMMFWNLSSPSGAFFPLSAYLGSSYFYVTIGSGADPAMISPQRIASLTSLPSNPQTPNDAAAYIISGLNRSQVFPAAVPHGRLGFPALTTDTVPLSEIPLRADGGSVLINGTTQALLSEQNNNLDKAHWSSQSTGGSFFGNTLYSQTLWSRLQALNIPNRLDLGDESDPSSLGYAFVHGQAPANALWSAMLLNSLNPESAPYDYSGRPFDTDYTLVPGAFGTAWYSFPTAFAGSLAWNGGSGGISTVGEPLASNIPFAHCMNELLIKQQACLALANFWSAPFNPMGATAFIDPLYSPYANSPQPPPPRAPAAWLPWTL